MKENYNKVSELLENYNTTTSYDIITFILSILVTAIILVTSITMALLLLKLTHSGDPLIIGLPFNPETSIVDIILLPSLILTTFIVYKIRRFLQLITETKVELLLEEENFESKDFRKLYMFYNQANQTLCVSGQEKVEWALEKLNKTKNS